MTREDDGEFFDLFDGLDDNVPGPSNAFASELLNDLQAGFGSPARPVVEIGDEPDAPLFALDGAAQEPVNTGWWMAAAVAVIGLLAAGLFVLTSANNDAAIVAADDPTAGSTLAEDETEVVSPTTTAPTSTVTVGFSSPLGFTQVTDQSLEASFTSTIGTVFNATLRNGDQVVATTSGDARADEPTVVAFDGLVPSVLHSIEVTLLGQPTVVSERLEIRTSGENTPIEISGLAVDSVSPTSASITFDTNLCARASVVVLDARDQREVQRVVDNVDGPCVQNHALDIGGDAPLEPATDYVLLVEVSASDGEDGSAENVTSESVSLRTEN